MEQRYWLRRERASLAKAQAAISAEARLIHFDLAGRYSVQAANCDETPTNPSAAPAASAPISHKD